MRTRTSEAFSHYSAANALRLKSHPYNAGKLTKLVDRCIEAFTAEAFAERRGGCDAADPIFVVGMPRSGSTLIEQILSSHSLVEGTTELHDIAALSRDAGDYPKDVLALDLDARRRFGEEYLKRASVQRRTDRPASSIKCPTTGCSCRSFT